MEEAPGSKEPRRAYGCPSKPSSLHCKRTIRRTTSSYSCPFRCMQGIRLLYEYESFAGVYLEDLRVNLGRCPVELPDLQLSPVRIRLVLVQIDNTRRSIFQPLEHILWSFREIHRQDECYVRVSQLVQGLA